jgi:hypothetical protein
MSKKEFWKRQPRLKCPDCPKTYQHGLSFIYHQVLRHGCTREQANERFRKVVAEYNSEIRKIQKRIDERRRQ